MDVLRLVGDRVLIDPLPPKGESGNILIPESSQWLESPCVGVVRAVGEGMMTAKGVQLPPSVKVGDLVLFNLYGDVHEMRMDLRDAPYLIVSENQILGVIEEE